ncbi:MAG: dihydroorotate dehydrogenase [Acidobacteria bacterium]|nr:dihydroorotate dehydrogenase [Acidobacteriota bacterium]
MKPPARLATELCGLTLSTPVIAASGTFAYGVEMDGLVEWPWIGAVVVKGLSREPMNGNPPPRVWEAASGMMNSIGLQNIGVRSFVETKLPGLRRLGVPVIANVFGFAVEDYQEVVRVLEDAGGVAAYELNVSCPNTKHGGMFFSADPALLADLLGQVLPLIRSGRPAIVKLSPNVAAIEPVAKAAEASGAQAISLVNTFVSLAIDARTRRPRLGAGFGGLSGPAIKPIALRLVYQAARAVRIPVIGLGGIATGEDAAEFMIAGASAVEVGTASFWDPASVGRIARELERFLMEEGVAAARDLVATLDMGEQKK